jgi:hypothetical protein
MKRMRALFRADTTFKTFWLGLLYGGLAVAANLLVWRMIGL